MNVGVRWLQASNDEVAAAMATVRRESRPSWVPTKRQVLVHVNFCLILWYLFFVLMFYGIQIHTYEVRQASAADISGLLVAAAVLAVWLFGTFWLRRWAALPPSPRARMKEWRQTLPALANGFEPKPSPHCHVCLAHHRGWQRHPRIPSCCRAGSRGRQPALSFCTLC